MLRSSTVALLSATTLACGIVGATAQHDHAKLRGRLVFADHEKPVVRILDLDTGTVTHSFNVPKPNPGFTTSEDGRFVVITTGDEAGTVRFLDSGLIAESHGDHKDVEKADPKLLDLAFTGDRPAHVVSENGWITVFYDGQRPWERKSDAKVHLVELKSLSGKKPNLDLWQSPAPQHGIVVPLGRKQWLMSQPNPAYAKGDDKSASSRPNGFEVMERGKGWKVLASFNDQSKADASCKLFHGHASLKNTHVFGCAEGADGGMLVIAKAKSGQWTSRKIAYPDERRTSTLKGAEGGRYLLGNYGLKSPYDALIRVDPAAKSLTVADVMPVPGNQPACQFELSHNGKQAINLTPDGRLRIYDIASAWKELAVFEAVPAFDCTFDAKTPKPSLAVIGDSAFISDPVNKRIREFHLDTLKQGLDLPIDGMPTNIADGGGGG